MSISTDGHADGWTVCVAADRGNGTAMKVWYLAAISAKPAAVKAVQALIRPIDQVTEVLPLEASHLSRRGVRPGEIYRLGDKRPRD